MMMLGFGGTDPPKMNQTSNGFVVSHREYIQDISSSQPFILENFPLNPGMIQTFPWLSQIADNFEEWIPEGIVFEYKTMSSNTVVNSTTTNPGLGTVVIATQYNSLNNDFGNKQQMENYENAVSSDPSRSLIHPIETAKPQTPVQPLYVRTGALTATATTSNDLRFYDLGKTSVATVGQQSNNFVIGELWISYRIRFLKPRLQTGVGNNEQGNIDHFQLFGASAGIGGVTAVLPARPLGTQLVLIPPKQGSTLGGVVSGGICPIADQQAIAFPASLGGPHPFPIFAIVGGVVNPTQVVSAVNTYYFPPGITKGKFKVTYVALYGVAGVPASQIPVAVTATNGCAGFLALNNTAGVNVATFIDNTATANTTTDMMVLFLEVSTNYANFSFTGSAGMTTPTYAELFVEQLPEAFA